MLIYAVAVAVPHLEHCLSFGGLLCRRNTKRVESCDGTCEESQYWWCLKDQGKRVRKLDLFCPEWKR